MNFRHGCGIIVLKYKLGGEVRSGTEDVMDYNYVRMRNARHAGDTSLALYYEKLCNKGISREGNTKLLNAALAILLAVAVILGAYIGYDRFIMPDEEPVATDVNAE